MTVAILLLCLSAPLLHAEPHRPTQDQLQAIQDEIDSAKALRSGPLADSLMKTRAFEQRMGLRDPRGNLIPSAPPFEVAMNRLNEDERAAYLTALRERIARQEAMAAHLDSAISIALVAYGIANPKNPPRGTIRSGFPKPDPFDPDLLPSFLGQTAVWQPHYSDELGEGNKVYGATEHDGNTVIGFDAFTYPGKLAATLYHESRHFQELTTPGVDVANTPASEVRIRESVARFERTLFRLSESDLAEREMTLRNFRRSVEPWQLLLNDGFDPQRRSHLSAFNSSLRGRVNFPGAPARGSSHDEALVSIGQQADMLARRVEQDAENRRAYEQAERRRASEALERERQRLEDGRRLWASLEDFARRFCQAAVDGRVPESMYPEWLEWRNGNYLAFSRDQPMVDLTVLHGPVECADFFENQILVARRAGFNHDVLTFEWAAEVVREAHRRSHPAVPSLPTPSPETPAPAEPPSDPIPDGTIPSPPAIPHCRYHGWCQEPPPERRK